MAHTHDGMDWTARIAEMRRTDALEAEVNALVADRLVDQLPAGATVVDVGSGSGGMATAFARALAVRGGGTVVLVDATPELLAAAKEAAGAVAGVEVVEFGAGTEAAGAVAGVGAVEFGAGTEAAGAVAGVTVTAVEFDAADDGIADAVGPADLVWAARVVHHLPDERAGVARLAGLLRPGGTLALAEGGLAKRCLPWDVGVGAPGLEDRLHAARAAWFCRMRASMDGVVRAGVGWNRLLSDAGLVDVRSFSYLVDLPAPASAEVRAFVADYLDWMVGVVGEFVSDDDRAAVARLLDADGPDWVGHRDDVFILSAATVHLGTR